MIDRSKMRAQAIKGSVNHEIEVIVVPVVITPVTSDDFDVLKVTD